MLSYSPGPDPLPVRDPRPRLNDEGYPPVIIVTTNAFTIGKLLVDQNGHYILDGDGNAIGVGPATWGTLIGANASRNTLNFTLPAAFGLWLNPSGGPCAPGWPGSVFYAPGTYYEAFGAASQPAMNYFTTIAGLLVVVQSAGGGIPPGGGGISLGGGSPSGGSPSGGSPGGGSPGGPGPVGDFSSDFSADFF